jgi:hypothetical protein
VAAETRKFFSALAQQHASVVEKEAETMILVGDIFSGMPRDTARRWHQTLGRSQLRSRHDPDAMDVDAMRMDLLSAEESTKESF